VVRSDRYTFYRLLVDSSVRSKLVLTVTPVGHEHPQQGGGEVEDEAETGIGTGIIMACHVVSCHVMSCRGLNI
jgi:hypothetical protein